MGTPNKYSPYSHSCNPPPITLPPHFGGESQRHPLTPPYPPPYQRVEPQDPPHLKHRKSWGAREGKGGCPHPIHLQAPPSNPSCGLRALMGRAGGGLGEGGREGRVPPARPPPQIPGERVLLVKNPPGPRRHWGSAPSLPAGPVRGGVPGSGGGEDKMWLPQESTTSSRWSARP